ncbi:MAG: FtsQ-type POTRA domain-containing protein [Alphaproteobacteria bacterium]|nr:MAG: FtsQ-type POTRA domain-containing protein [Alphaproteobacteria bacterium]
MGRLTKRDRTRDPLREPQFDFNARPANPQPAAAQAATAEPTVGTLPSEVTAAVALPKVVPPPVNLPQAKALVRRRRRPLPRWVTRYVKPAAMWAASGAFVLGLAFAGVTVARQVEPDQVIAELDDIALQVSATLGLMVRDVLVEGRDRQAGEDILAALDVQYGTPILSVDVDAARERLERLPWIEQAVVERHLPDRIWVRLTEREPLALWQMEGKLHVVDAKGVVILQDASGWGHLPLVIGKGAARAADEFLVLIASEPDLAEKVSSATFIGERRWNVRLSNGIDVRLPEDGAAEAWSRLAELERTQRLLQRDVLAIDLRIPDRMVLQMSQPPAPLPSQRRG